MRHIIQIIVLASFSFLIGCASKDITRSDLSGDQEKYSYAVGFQTGKMFNEHIHDFDIDIFMKALRDALEKDDDDLLMTLPEINEAMQRYQANLEESRLLEQRRISEINQAKEIEYLRENSEKDGVFSLPSGIQYEVLRKSDNLDKPEPNSHVSVHYHGTLLDGTVFDSSRDRGEPTTLSLDMVIPGWKEVITKMSVGDRWLVTIPSELAYGEQGSGQVIPPSSTLIFDIELLEIKG